MNSEMENFVVEPLGREHDRAAFCCGNEALDRYFKEQATQDSRKNVAAPFVLVDRGSKVVKGFYTLCMSSIELAWLPQETVRKLPKYPIIPAILLGRLAVDQSCRGRGVGRFLVADALKRSLQSQIAWTAMVVDAKDDQARAFYEHYGFLSFLERPMKLYMLKQKIVQAAR